MPEFFCSCSAFLSCSWVISPSRTRISPSLSWVIATLAVRNSLKLKGLKWDSRLPRSRFCGWNARKRDVREDGVQQFGSDARHAVETAETAKWTVLVAPG